MSAAAEHDLVIVGGGPAGLSAALYATRYGLDAVTIESGPFGGQITTTPDLDNYPGLPGVGGSELGELMHSHAESLGAVFASDEVIEISQVDGRFLTHCYGADYLSGALIYAAGARPRLAGFEGEESFRGRGVSYCATCDGMFYRNKDVFVVGGGNTACDEALFLSGLASNVTMVVRRDALRADAALAEKVASTENIKVRYLTKITSVKGETLIEEIVLSNTLTGECETLTFAPGTTGVFVAVGQNPNVGLIDRMVELAPDGSIQTDEVMAAKTPGLFVAGDVRNKPLRQVVTAASDGAVAAHTAAEFLRTM